MRCSRTLSIIVLAAATSCIALAGAQQKSSPKARKSAASKTKPAPPPEPAPAPTPPSEPCAECENLLGAIEKGAMWHTFLEFPEDSKLASKEPGSTEIHTAAAFVVTGADMHGKSVTLNVGTVLSGPLDALRGLKNPTYRFATDIPNTSATWKPWLQHVAYNLELKKVKVYLVFFDKNELSRQKEVKASIQVEANPGAVRELAGSWLYGPK